MTISSRGSDKATAAARQALSMPHSQPAAWVPRLSWLAEFVVDALARSHTGRAMGADELAAQLSAGLPPLSAEVGTVVLDAGVRPALVDAAGQTVMTRLGACVTADLFRLVCAVWAAAGLAAEEPPATPVLREGVRGLAAALEQAHGGRSIEVRIPPVVAVQLAAAAEGPIHRRGTPPNVVEASPEVFLRMATGLLSWEAAVAAGLSHSGAHADEVAGFWPVLDLR